MPPQTVGTVTCPPHSEHDPICRCIFVAPNEKPARGGLKYCLRLNIKHVIHITSLLSYSFDQMYALFMSKIQMAHRGDDQFMLRFPEGMRDRIKESAAANGRSMNSEIIARLAATMESEASLSETITKLIDDRIRAILAENRPSTEA